MEKSYDHSSSDAKNAFATMQQSAALQVRLEGTCLSTRKATHQAHINKGKAETFQLRSGIKKCPLSLLLFSYFFTVAMEVPAGAIMQENRNH